MRHRTYIRIVAADGTDAANPRRPPLRALPGREASRQPPRRDLQLVRLVYAARGGDRAAWTELIGRFDPTLRRIAGSYRLAPVDADDVVQAVWLELVRHIHRIREPAAIAGWLETATRRRAMRVLQSHVSEHLTEDPMPSERLQVDGPEAGVLARERHAVLARALTTLPDRHRRLMTLLLTQPTLDYHEIGERLAMPVGSIGPIRARSLARLAHHPELRALVYQEAALQAL